MFCTFTLLLSEVCAQNGCLLYFLHVMIVRHHHRRRRRRRRDDDDDNNNNNNNNPMAVGVANEFLFRPWIICLSPLTVKLI